jgi:hypothetical protein
MKYLTKRNILKRTAIALLAGFMTMGALTTNAVATTIIQDQDLVNVASFDIFDLNSENLEDSYIVKYENISFDEYGNKIEVRLVFEPSVEFKDYISERDDISIDLRAPITHRESFMGRAGTNTASRTVTNNMGTYTISFQFDLTSRPNANGIGFRMVASNARNLAFAAPGTRFSNPSLNILRDGSTGSLPAEINASVLAESTTSTQWVTSPNSGTWLLTATVSQSGLVRVYSN